jgi:hypothetical protein
MRTSFLKYEKKFTLQLQKGSCGYENIQVGKHFIHRFGKNLLI